MTQHVHLDLPPAVQPPSASIRPQPALVSFPDFAEDRKSHLAALRATRSSLGPSARATDVAEAMKRRSRLSLRRPSMGRSNSPSTSNDRTSLFIVRRTSAATSDATESDGGSFDVAASSPDLLFTLSTSTAGTSHPSITAGNSLPSIASTRLLESSRSFSSVPTPREGAEGDAATQSQLDPSPEDPAPPAADQPPTAAAGALPPPRSDRATSQPPELVLGELIAKGGSGAAVFACTFDGVPMAVKLMDRSKARKDQIETMVTEAELCRRLHHPRIVHFAFIGIEMGLAGSGGSHIAIVMEELPCNLEALIDRRRGASPARRAFSPLRLLHIAAQVAEGIAYLHGQVPPVLHRDIKPANCFTTRAMLQMDAEGDEGVPLADGMRLGDFDMSGDAEEPQFGFFGTPSTMAPEMFAFEEHHTPADVWSLGMLLQWALLLEDPFADATMQKLEDSVSASPPQIALFDPSAWPPYQWPSSLEGVARVAARCCAPKPTDRPSIGEVCSLLAAEITQISQNEQPVTAAASSF